MSMRELLHRSPFRRLGSDTSGAALVEFAISLPIMLLLFTMIIEGSRTFWSYQAAITGIRDATRYLGRAAVGCTLDAVTQSTVQDKMAESATGESFLPARVTVTPLVPTIDCSVADAPIATVSALVTIELPLGGMFTWFGGSNADITTVVTDTTRIYGT